MAMVLAMAALLLLAAPAVYSKQYTISWNQGTDYSSYGTSQTFAVGDTLVFTYSSLHGVDIVSQSDYASCNSGNALQSYSGGATTIILNTPGTMHFMCPTLGHCSSGMKLSIPVVATASPTTPSTSPSSSGSSSPTVMSPSTGSSSSCSPSTTGSTPVITTTTTTTNSLKSYSGVEGMFGNMNNFGVIGVSVVVAGLVGFMG